MKNTVSALDTSLTYDYTLPLSWEAGIAVNPYGRWWLSASYWFRSVADPVGYPVLEGNVGDEKHIGFGIERRARPDGSVLGRIPLRFGFYYDTWHLQFPAGHDVNSIFLSVGSSVPLRRTTGSIDFTLEFGRTGSKDENLVDENIFRFGLSFSVSEPWSRRKEVRH